MLGINKTAIAVPDQHITTKDLLKSVEGRVSESLYQSLESLGIETRYSIVEDYSRYIVGKKERSLIDTTTSLGVKALSKLLDSPAVNLEDIVLFIGITNTPHRPMPCLSYEIMAETLGLLPKDVCVLNLQGQGCSTFLKALDIAKSFIANMKGKHVALVVSEAHTGYAHPFLEKNYHGLRENENNEDLEKTRDLIAHFLFGDGAVALLLNEDSMNSIVFDDIVHLSNLHAKDSELLTVNEGGSTHPVYPGFPVYHMDKHVPLKGMVYSKHLIEHLNENISQKNITLADDAHYFIHTGSKKIIDGVCSILNLPNPQKSALFSYNVLEKFANLSAASVPFMFHQFMQESSTNKELPQSLKGSYGIMLSFGVGFSGSAGLIGFR